MQQPGYGLKSVPAVLAHRKVRVDYFAVVLASGGHFVAHTYIAPFLGQISGIDTFALGMALLAYSAAGFFGDFFGDRMAGCNPWRGFVVATLIVALWGHDGARSSGQQ